MMTTTPTDAPTPITASTDGAPDGRSLMHRLAVRAGGSARPISGRRFFPLYGVLHHIGRRSGRRYATPVVIRGGADGVYVPLPFGESTAWYRNALAAGGVRATWKGRDVWLANPTVVGHAAATHAFSRPMNALLGVWGTELVVRFEAPTDSDAGG